MTKTVSEPLRLTVDEQYVPQRFRDACDLPRSTRQKWQEEVRGLFRPARNGYNDALSHLFVIDTLLRLSPEQMIRATALRDMLQKECPQVVWDTVTVGRILNELVEVADEHGQSCLRVRRDRIGAYFILDPGIHTYNFLADLRERASEKVAYEFEFLHNGVKAPDRTFSVWEDLNLAPVIGGIAVMLGVISCYNPALYAAVA